METTIEEIHIRWLVPNGISAWYFLFAGSPIVMLCRPTENNVHTPLHILFVDALILHPDRALLFHTAKCCAPID